MTISSSARIFLVLGTLACGEVSWAQNFPTKPVRIVTSATGGSSDFVARLLAPSLSAGFNQQFIVDNRGGGAVPVDIVAKAPPDGHTLLYYGSTLWLLPLLQQSSYDTLRDFSPVSIVVDSPCIVAVHPALPAKSIKELIALAKAKPGFLNYGSAAAGSTSHLAAELFKALAGVDIVRVSYNGTGPVMNAIVSGEVQVLLSASGGVAPHITAGRLRALAVTSAKRSPSFPNLPTVAEAGLPGYEYGQLSGYFAPARTPAPIVGRLSSEIRRVVSIPEIKDRLFNAGLDAEGSTPEQAGAAVKGEITRLAKVIKEAKIRAE